MLSSIEIYNKAQKESQSKMQRVVNMDEKKIRYREMKTPW